MEWFADFHFLRPYWLVLLVVPLWMAFKLMRDDKTQSSWAEVCDEHLLDFLLIKGKNTQRRSPYILSSLISLLVILSLAGPTWIKKVNPALSVDNPVMILLNMSSDMWAKDVSPSRFMRSKYIIKDLLHDFTSTESGLLVYSREPFVVSPLAEDANIIDNLLPALSMDVMPENGDRLDRAIDLAVERLQNSGYQQGNLVILTADIGERFDAALESASRAQDSGFDVNVIKVSTYPSDKLQILAERGNGLFLDYNQNYSELYQKINDITTRELQESANMQTIWEDAGYYLLWLPALGMLYYFRRGIILILIIGLWGNAAYAGWFLNDNQEGLKYFKEQQYDKAAQKFIDEQWRGAAAYKNGDYNAAYQSFARQNDATSLYNQGNALAKSGKINDAIAKYEEVLQKDANFEDARFNLEYLKKQQQNQQQSQSSGGEDEQQQKQQQSQSSGGEDEQQQNQQQSQSSGGEDEQQQNQQQSQSSGGEDEQQQNQQQSQSSGGEDEQQQNQQQSQSSGGEDEQQQNQQQSQSSGGEDEQQQNSQERSDAEQKTQVQYGDENENAAQNAEAIQTQAGDRSDEEKEKIRAHLQKFRDVPEDKGGLLRAIIYKEFQKNRYLEE